MTLMDIHVYGRTLEDQEDQDHMQSSHTTHKMNIGVSWWVDQQLYLRQGELGKGEMNGVRELIKVGEL